MPRTVRVRAIKSFPHHGRNVVAGDPVDLTPKEAINHARIGNISLTRVLPDRQLHDRNMTVRTPRGTPPAPAPSMDDPQPAPGTPGQSPTGLPDKQHDEGNEGARTGRRGGSRRSRRTGADAPEPSAAETLDDPERQQYERTDLVGADNGDPK